MFDHSILITTLAIMPYATHWICCQCNFGPMLICNYPSCLRCQHIHATEGCCTYITENDSTSDYEGVSTYQPVNDAPSSVSMKTLSAPKFDSTRRVPFSSPNMMGRQTAAPAARTRYARTDLYICCQCGDGPKVYQNQSRCVACDHDVCPKCIPVKY